MSKFVLLLLWGGQGEGWGSPLEGGCHCLSCPVGWEEHFG